MDITQLKEDWHSRRPYLNKKSYIHLCLENEYGQNFQGIIDGKLDVEWFLRTYSIEADQKGERDLLISKWDVLKALAEIGQKNLFKDESIDSPQSVTFSFELKITPLSKQLTLPLEE